MSFFKRSASAPSSSPRRRGPRGVSLIELMISQVIMLVLLAGLVGLVVSLIRALHSGTGHAEAQVRLREASHLFLRDLQGLGGDEGGRAADLVTVIDGGATAADQLTVFKRDSTICGGDLPVLGVPGITTVVNGTPCPILATGACTAAALEHQRVMVRGKQRSIVLLVDAVDVGTCSLTFSAGGPNADAVAKYLADHSQAGVTDLPTVLTSLGGIAGSSTLLFGMTLEYRIGGTGPANVLQRRVNSVDPAGFVDVLKDTLDLQVMRGFDLNRDGALQDEEFETDPGFGAAVAAAGASGASADTFVGVKIGLVTFAKTVDGIVVAPPALFGNRNLSGLPSDRRYRSSFVFAAARNP